MISEKLELRRNSPFVAETLRTLQQVKATITSDPDITRSDSLYVINRVQELEVFFANENYHDTTSMYAFIRANSITRILRKYPQFEVLTRQLDNFVFVTQAETNRFAELLSMISEMELVEVKKRLAEFLTTDSDTATKNRKFLILNFFSNGTEKIFGALREIPNNAIDTELQQPIFNDPFFSYLLELVSRFPDDLSYETAILINQQFPSEILEKAKSQLDPKPTAFNPHIKLAHEQWYLCASAEWKLATALEGESIVVKDRDGEALILVKSVGRLTGLTLRAFQTPDGQIIPRGVWVSPVDDLIRDRIRHSIATGHQTISHKFVGGTWVLMRGLVTNNMTLPDSAHEPNQDTNNLLDDSDQDNTGGSTPTMDELVKLAERYRDLSFARKMLRKVIKTPAKPLKREEAY